MGGFATAFIPFLFNFKNANLDPLKRHYGRERTMAEYLATQGGPAVAPRLEQAPAHEPASI